MYANKNTWKLQKCSTYDIGYSLYLSSLIAIRDAMQSHRQLTLVAPRPTSPGSRFCSLQQSTQPFRCFLLKYLALTMRTPSLSLGTYSFTNNCNRNRKFSLGKQSFQDTVRKYVTYNVTCFLFSSKYYSCIWLAIKSNNSRSIRN